MNKLKIVLYTLFVFNSINVFALDLAEGCSVKNSTTDKNVFNWRYYLQHNYDLIEHGIQTPVQACNHWISNGISEGRQAHAGFHSKQYLTRYPDVANYYGINNYYGAIKHFVENGLREWRIGYLENGILSNYETTTISGVAGNSKIFIGASKRTAGAIDSLIFNNVEFINSYDHGRQLQIATVSSWNGEHGSYNPTEAGSCQNWTSNNTSSILYKIFSYGSTMTTSVIPAFWFEPSPVNIPGSVSCPGIGKGGGAIAYGHDFKKTVTIGEEGQPHVIKFQIHVEIDEYVPQDYTNLDSPRVRFEVPTGYIAGEFNEKYRFNIAANSLIDITSMACHEKNKACTSEDPLIFTKSSKTEAIGVCNGVSLGAIFEKGITHPRYESWGEWFVNDPISHTTKWAVLKYIDAEVYPGLKVDFNTYVVVGKSEGGFTALDSVRKDMEILYKKGKCI